MSESMVVTPAVPQSRSRPQYFFLSRRPRLRGFPREWVRPPTDEEYQRLAAREGFIVASSLQGEASDVLKADVRELEQHLMQHFWRLDQEAKYYQNWHYLYQWTFIITAFLTTALSALTVFIHGVDGDQSLGIIGLTELLGLITAIISGIAAAVAFLNANQAPQQQWFKARAKAESLRSLYFVFLARQAPFDVQGGGERIQRLRRAVLNVLREREKEDTSR